MTCYLLFKEPMKYLVPRGSGRPLRFRKGLHFRMGLRFRTGLRFREGLRFRTGLHFRMGLRSSVFVFGVFVFVTTIFICMLLTYGYF